MTADATEFDEYATFADASEAMMGMMRDLLRLDLWLVTRVHDEEWIVLHSLGKGPIGAGDVLPLKATICNEMLAGRGPNIASDVSRVPAYRGTPVVKVHPIGSYAGAPLIVNGAVYGVLCGMSEVPHKDITEEQTPHLITAARTLSTILGQQLHSESLARRVERAETDALVDDLTQLYNRRGWEQLVAFEQARGRRYGHKHAVFFMDIDGLKAVNDEQGHAAGDALIVRAAEAIRGVIREHDVAARVGGDEFALLATETAGAEATIVRERLAEGFKNAGVSVSIGFARADNLDLAAATREADEQMYRRKAERSES
jgi:diguanylate cyclase (GGDEF)-like protein